MYSFCSILNETCIAGKSCFSRLIPVDFAAFYPPSQHGTKTDVEGGFSLRWALFRSRFALIYYTLRPFVTLHISHSFTLVLSAWCCKCNLSSMHCDKRIKHLQEKILSSLETVCCPFWIVACHHQCNAGHLGKHWLSVLQPMSPISSFFESFELKRNVACTERKQTIKHQ